MNHHHHDHKSDARNNNHTTKLTLDDNDTASATAALALRRERESRRSQADSHGHFTGFAKHHPPARCQSISPTTTSAPPAAIPTAPAVSDASDFNTGIQLVFKALEAGALLLLLLLLFQWLPSLR